MNIRTVTFALLSACLLLAGGCDRVRAALGKPTSADIASLRREMAESERLADRVAKIIADSVRTADSLAKAEVQPGAALNKAYYISGGSFAVRANARKMFDKFSADGLKPSLTQFRGGNYVVLLGGFDTKAEADSAMAMQPYAGYAEGTVCVFKRNQDLTKIE